MCCLLFSSQAQDTLALHTHTASLFNPVLQDPLSPAATGFPLVESVIHSTVPCTILNSLKGLPFDKKPCKAWETGGLFVYTTQDAQKI